MGLLVVIALVCIAIIIYQEICKLRYWKRLQIPCDPAVPIFGNLTQSILQKKAIAHIQMDMYKKYSNHRYFGYFMFNRPSLVIRDFKLVKQICIRDFDSFYDHREFLPKKADPFWSKILFAKKGREWHTFRKIIAPAFSQSKLKQIFPYITECANRLIGSLPESNETVSMDIYDLFIKISNDLALNLAFGINCNSFKDPNNAFFTVAKKEFVLSRIKAYKFFGAAISTTFANLLKITFFSEDTKHFYRKVMKDTLDYRKKHNLVRVDVLHLLKEAQKGTLQFEKEDAEEEKLLVPKEVSGTTNSNTPKIEITDDDIMVQMMGLLMSSFDTFTIYLCNTTYEIALNPDVQEKLINEIDETWQKCNGHLVYDDLVQMKYFDMVCLESLRYRSPTVFLDRVVTKPYTIPPVLPHEKPLHLKRGQDITIPVYCFTRDEQFFENPNKFDPERFNNENKARNLPHTILGFGYGARFCMGRRMALLQTKITLFYFLLKYKVVPIEKTAVPFILNKTNISQCSENGYWFGLELRDKNRHL